jgi:hypothetical protein
MYLDDVDTGYNQMFSGSCSFTFSRELNIISANTSHLRCTSSFIVKFICLFWLFIRDKAFYFDPGAR